MTDQPAIDPTRAFRDYATRISFNMSLSRNQVGHLAGVVMEIENEELLNQLDFDTRVKRKDQEVDNNGGRSNLFVTGRRSLLNMGLVVHDPRWLAASKACELDKRLFWKYTGPSYQLTPAGQHVVELLRIAGLIPKAAANSNKKHKRKAA
jgi:hypothetical protein